MATIIDFDRLARGAAAARFDMLDDRDRAQVEGFAAALLAQCGFDAIYKALTPDRQQMVDGYISDLLHQQQEYHTTK